MSLSTIAAVAVFCYCGCCGRIIIIMFFVDTNKNGHDSVVVVMVEKRTNQTKTKLRPYYWSTRFTFVGTAGVSVVQHALFDVTVIFPVTVVFAAVVLAVSAAARPFITSSKCSSPCTHTKTSGQRMTIITIIVLKHAGGQR